MRSSQQNAIGLRDQVRYEPIGFELLPARFTFGQLQHRYEINLDEPLDRRNFRKKILGMSLLLDTGEIQRAVAHRAARLHRFNERKYQQLRKRSFSFRL